GRLPHTASTVFAGWALRKSAHASIAARSGGASGPRNVVSGVAGARTTTPERLGRDVGKARNESERARSQASHSAPDAPPVKHNAVDGVPRRASMRATLMPLPPT